MSRPALQKLIRLLIGLLALSGLVAAGYVYHLYRAPNVLAVGTFVFSALRLAFPVQFLKLFRAWTGFLIGIFLFVSIPIFGFALLPGIEMSLRDLPFGSKVGLIMLFVFASLSTAIILLEKRLTVALSPEAERPDIA